MADNDGITTTQSFTERALKYGRNMMAAAVPIIVFALVPVVDLAKSRPLNFELKAGGEIWIWGILLALLAYYGFRFFGLVIPDFLEWREEFGDTWSKLTANLKRQIQKENEQSNRIAHVREDRASTTKSNELRTLDQRIERFERDIKTAQVEIKNLRFQLRDYYLRRAYFWLVDAGLPVAFFLGAAIAASIEISALLPPDAPSTP